MNSPTEIVIPTQGGGRLHRKAHLFTKMIAVHHIGNIEIEN